MYFCIKQFFKSSDAKAVRDVFLNMKKIYYNLMTKLEMFSQLLVDVHKNDSVLIQSLAAISRTVTELHVPLFEDWRGEAEPHRIPTIAQFSEEIETEVIV